MASFPFDSDTSAFISRDDIILVSISSLLRNLILEIYPQGVYNALKRIPCGGM